jgi:hypothetical protein
VRERASERASERERKLKKGQEKVYGYQSVISWAPAPGRRVKSLHVDAESQYG